jgi:hypothetical protein
VCEGHVDWLGHTVVFSLKTGTYNIRSCLLLTGIPSEQGYLSLISIILLSMEEPLKYFSHPYEPLTAKSYSLGKLVALAKLLNYFQEYLFVNVNRKNSEAFVLCFVLHIYILSISH